MKTTSLLGMALLLPCESAFRPSFGQDTPSRSTDYSLVNPNTTIGQPQLSLWTATFSAKLNKHLERRSQIGIEVTQPASTAPADSVTVEVTFPKRAPQTVTLRRVDAQGTRFRGVINVSKPGKISVSYGQGAERQEKQTFIRWPVVG
jgi:hypothetical protein